MVRCGRQRRKSSCRTKKRSKCQSSCRKGKLTRNPFFNFLRCFRIRHCGWPAKKIAIEGAKTWCKLTKAQRKIFYKEARKKSCARGPLIVPPPCCKGSSKSVGAPNVEQKSAGGVHVAQRSVAAQGGSLNGRYENNISSSDVSLLFSLFACSSQMSNAATALNMSYIPLS